MAKTAERLSSGAAMLADFAATRNFQTHGALVESYLAAPGDGRPPPRSGRSDTVESIAIAEHRVGDEHVGRGRERGNVC
jgi:hypothetical protein